MPNIGIVKSSALTRFKRMDAEFFMDPDEKVRELAAKVQMYRNRLAASEYQLAQKIKEVHTRKHALEGEVVEP
jgi:hypothetical protein